MGFSTVIKFEHNNVHYTFEVMPDGSVKASHQGWWPLDQMTAIRALMSSYEKMQLELNEVKKKLSQA